jgi:hypothetical protein
MHGEKTDRAMHASPQGMAAPSRGIDPTDMVAPKLWLGRDHNLHFRALDRAADRG